jgi:hypothetical protein
MSDRVETVDLRRLAAGAARETRGGQIMRRRQQGQCRGFVAGGNRLRHYHQCRVALRHGATSIRSSRARCRLIRPYCARDPSDGFRTIQVCPKDAGGGRGQTWCMTRTNEERFSMQPHSPHAWQLAVPGIGFALALGGHLVGEAVDPDDRHRAVAGRAVVEGGAAMPGPTYRTAKAADRT